MVSAEKFSTTRGIQKVLQVDMLDWKNFSKLLYLL